MKRFVGVWKEISKAQDGLAEVLLAKAKEEENRRREVTRRRDEKERERRRQQRREEQRRRHAKALEALRREQKKREIKAITRMWNRARVKAAREAQLNREKKIAAYRFFLALHHQLMQDVDDVIKRGTEMGVNRLDLEKLRQPYLNMCMKDWPEPYRSQCTFDESEQIAFTLDPYREEYLVRFFSSLRRTRRVP